MTVICDRIYALHYKPDENTSFSDRMRIKPAMDLRYM